jgi:hypothetical protein
LLARHPQLKLIISIRPHPRLGPLARLLDPLLVPQIPRAQRRQAVLVRARARRIGIHMPDIHVVCIYSAGGAGGERDQVFERSGHGEQRAGGRAAYQYGGGYLLGP